MQFFEFQTRPLLLSLILGWISIVAHFFSFNVSTQNFQLTLNWAYFFPALISVAYGARYAFLSATLGLAAFYPFMLWPNNGWANCITSLYSLFWLSGLGWIHQRHIKENQWFWHPVLHQFVWGLAYLPIIVVFFPLTLSINPSPWGENHIYDIPSDILWAIAFKGFLTMSMAMMVALLLFRINFFRVLFGLPALEKMRSNGKISMAAIGVALFCVLIYEGLEGIFFTKDFPAGLFILSPQDLLILIALCFCGICSAYFVCTQSEKRLDAFVELRENEKLFRQLANAIPRGVFYQIIRYPDGHRKFTYLSSGCEDLHGIPAQAIIDDATQLYRQVDPQNQALFRHLEEYASTHLSPFAVETLMFPPDKEPFWALLRSTPQQMPDGSLLWHGVEMDITDLKKAEQALAVSKAELEAKVQERTSELAQALDKAEQATVAKSMFLANMSHEIRTPLNAVLGLGHLLQQTHLDDKQSSYLSKLQMSAQGLLDVINDILDISKIEADKIEIHHNKFNLRHCINHISEMMAFGIQNKGLVFSIEYDASIPEFVIGDEFRLRQVLLNLCGNALKFTEKGSIVLGVQNKGTRTLFTIQDTGIGMDDEQLERIFSPFEQADILTTRKFGGTGLGLSISNRLVQLMGGKIHVSSQLGQGSQFDFDIELPGAGEELALELAPMNKTRHCYRILLVEDQEVNQLVARELLEIEGHHVEIASNGRIALEMVTANPSQWDLILMDLHMPEMDGFESTRRIRQIKECKNTPIIALTADTRQDIIQDLSELGFNDFLIKPMEPSNLHQTIQNWGSIGNFL